MAEKLCSFLFFYSEFWVYLFLTREEWLALNLYSFFVMSGVKEWRSPSSEMSGAPSFRSFEMNSAHFVLSVMKWAGEDEWCFKEWRSPSSEMSGAPSSRSFEMNSAHFVLSVMEWAGEVRSAPPYTPPKWLALFVCFVMEWAKLISEFRNISWVVF